MLKIKLCERLRVDDLAKKVVDLTIKLNFDDFFDSEESAIEEITTMLKSDEGKLGLIKMFEKVKPESDDFDDVKEIIKAIKEFA